MEPFPISWNPRLSQQLAAPDRAVAKHMRSFGGALLAAVAIPAAHAQNDLDGATGWAGTG
jgi:hypothetical protein